MRFILFNSTPALYLLTALIAAALLFTILTTADNASAQQPAATPTPTSAPDLLPPAQDGAAQDANSAHTHDSGGSRITSQGVAVHGADNWHAAGYTGEGVKVGVITHFEFKGISSLMGTEAPSNITARCYTSRDTFTSNIADCDTGDDIHSTRTVETIYDVAPHMTLYIANPPLGSKLREAVQWMTSQGVDVIHYYASTWDWEGPGDGTAPGYPNAIIRTVDMGVNGGAIWINSASKYPRGTWYGSYPSNEYEGFMDFGSNDHLNGIELDAEERMRVQLRWEGSWGGADKDLNLHLYNSEGSQVQYSTDRQQGRSTDRPFESFEYTAPTSGTYFLAVKRHAGSAPSWVQLQVKRGAELEYYTISGSTGNPAESANPGMLAVGNAAWNNTNAVRIYSARGPTPDGRTKPDIVGVACTLTSTPIGNTTGCASSNGAAHVAGLAALVKQRFPNYTPAQIATYLKSNAEARGTVPNNTWGYGLAKLPALPTPTPTTAPTNTPTLTPTVARDDSGAPITPTPTSTTTRADVPSPTPTRTATTVTTSGNANARISQLEGQVGTLRNQVNTQRDQIEEQGGLINSLSALINRLTARLDALDGGSDGAPAPTPTHTPTLTNTPVTVLDGAPTPTPTTVPTATATRTSGSTLNPACIGKIGLGWLTGTWNADCQSTKTPPTAKEGTRYARYYAFTLDAPSRITVTISSTDVRDTYLYLLQGSGNQGEIVNRGDTEIVEQLDAGTYTIEATTYNLETAGNFTLTLDIAATGVSAAAGAPR